MSERATLNAEEQAVMDHIVAAMAGIQAMGLRKVNDEYVNATELASAVHVLQAFVIQHMLQRLEPDHWGRWYDLAAPDAP